MINWLSRDLKDRMLWKSTVKCAGVSFLHTRNKMLGKFLHNKIYPYFHC